MYEHIDQIFADMAKLGDKISVAVYSGRDFGKASKWSVQIKFSHNNIHLESQALASTFYEALTEAWMKFENTGRHGFTPAAFGPAIEYKPTATPADKIPF